MTPLISHRRCWWPHIYLTLLWLLIFSVNLSAQETVRVKYVIDGDTIILQNGKNVRYLGIDAPEIDHENSKAEPFGYAARTFNRKIIGSKRVRFEYDMEKQDRYGRTLAYVYLLDGTFINQKMLESGLAYFLYNQRNHKYADNLLQAQREAMAEKKGIWQAWHENRQHYIGNRKSKRFHFPSCRYGKKIGRNNRIIFSRQWDAYWQGFAPCKKCIK